MAKRPTWETPITTAANRASYELVSLDGLHAAMVAKGYTAGYQLAQAAGLSPATVNHLVHGRRHKASPNTVHRIREVLGRDADQIFVLEKCTVPTHRAA